MNIRQAISNDGSLLSSLSVDVQRLHAEKHPDIFKMPENDDFADAFFGELLINPLTRIFIAEEDGMAFGCIVCKLIEREESPFTVAMRYLLVDQISVCTEAQGKGVGRALIEQAFVQAKDWGLSRVQLDSWVFNSAAHGFFERMGFEKFNHRFCRNL